MFQFIYNQLLNISPVWYVLLALYVLKNVINKTHKIVDNIEGSLVVQVDDLESFNQHLKENEVVIADFYANWCPPCKAAAPVFAILSKEYTSVKFLKVDVDKNTKTSHAMDIKAMPTFIVFKNGNEVESLQGFSESNIRNLLSKHSPTSSKKT